MDEAGELLGEDLRRRARLAQGPAVYRCGAVRARAGRSGTRPGAVGHRLAASEREVAARRRRAAGSLSTDGTRTRTAGENPGRQSGTTLRVLTCLPAPRR